MTMKLEHHRIVLWSFAKATATTTAQAKKPRVTQTILTCSPSLRKSIFQIALRALDHFAEYKERLLACLQRITAELGKRGNDAGNRGENSAGESDDDFQAFSSLAQLTQDLQQLHGPELSEISLASVFHTKRDWQRIEVKLCDFRFFHVRKCHIPRLRPGGKC